MTLKSLRHIFSQYISLLAQLAFALFPLPQVFDLWETGAEPFGLTILQRLNVFAPTQFAARLWQVHRQPSSGPSIHIHNMNSMQTVWSRWAGNYYLIDQFSFIFWCLLFHLVYPCLIFTSNSSNSILKPLFHTPEQTFCWTGQEHGFFWFITCHACRSRGVCRQPRVFWTCLDPELCSAQTSPTKWRPIVKQNIGKHWDKMYDWFSSKLIWGWVKTY